jgi:type I restriction enzyme, S subunit
MSRLRHVATISPSVEGLGRANHGDVVSFIPLEAVWSDERFDPSRKIALTGDIGSYNAVAEGDLLVPKVSPTFAHGQTAVAVGLTGGRALATSEVFVVRPHDPEAVRFLKYRLLAQDFLQEGQASWFGVAGLKRVSADFVRDVRIDASAWAQRRAIADFLDREIARLRSLQSEIENALRTVAEELAGSVDRRTAHLARARLRFALTRIEQGWSPQCENREAGPDEWGVLKLGCVNGGTFVDDHKALPADVAPRAQLEVKEGDVLMSRANTRELVGSCALVEDCRPRLMLSDLLYRLVIEQSAWEPAFVVTALNSHRVRGEIAASAAGSAGSMPKLNHELVKNLTLPVCSLEEQRALLAQVNRDRERPARLAGELRELERGIGAYRNALITEAVTGRLRISQMSDTRMEESLHAVREGGAPEALAS